jgi:hypothetical protein
MSESDAVGSHAVEIRRAGIRVAISTGVKTEVIRD